MADALNTTSDSQLPQAPEQDAMRLRDGIAFYLVLLAIFAIGVFAWLTYGTWTQWIYVAAVYFCFGFLLNRKLIGSLVTWHPIYDTVDAVAGTKLRLFLTWPVSYGLLLAKLCVMRIL